MRSSSAPGVLGNQASNRQKPGAIIAAFLIAASAIAVLYIAFPTTARAADVRVTGSTLEYAAANAESNNVDASGFGGFINISDSLATLTAGPGCTQVTTKSVRCPSGPVASLDVTLLDGSDGFDWTEYAGSSRLPIHVDGGTSADTIITGSKDDTLIGGEGRDILNAGDGNDRIEGGGDRDELDGLPGNDLMIGGLGADLYKGGTGNDTVSYEDRTLDVTADLDDAVGDDGNPTQDYSAGYGYDTISTDVENITGGSGPDTLTGGANANVLIGGGGADTLDGGLGADVLTGGSGSDLVSYLTRTAGVTVGIGGGANDGSAQDGPVGARDDVNVDVENLAGGGGYDTLTGDGNANTLVGCAGNDTLSGAAGNDALHDGLLIYCVGGGQDLFDGGLDADSFSGLGGTEIVNYGDRADAVTADIGGGNDDGNSLDGPAGARDNIGSDVEWLSGGSGDDTLTGSGADNILIGCAGSDTLSGLGGADILANGFFCAGGGNDSFDGGIGADLFSGGGGTETVTYGSRATDVVAAIDGTPTSGNADDGAPGARDTVSADIENLSGGSGGDTLDGDGNANVLKGGAGADDLDGAAGDDTVNGEVGDDTLAGGSDEDTISGGDDNDTISAREGFADQISCDGGMSDSVVADIPTLDTVDPDCEDVDVPATSSIESVPDLDSPFPNSWVLRYTTGEDEDNDLHVEALDGAYLGDDRYYEITDSHPMAAGANCAHVGGDQTHVKCLQALAGEFAGNLKIDADTGAGDDKAELRITSLNLHPTLKLAGGQGNDELTNLGPGSVSGGAGDDTLTVEASEGFNGANLSKGDLNGGPGDDDLHGGPAADTLDGGTGADDISGGDEWDMLDYSSRTEDLDVTIDGQANDGGVSDQSGGRRDNANIDVDAVRAGSGDDHLVLADNTNRAGEAIGGEGNDVLDGGVGSDLMSGGDGHDTADYSGRTGPIEVDLGNPTFDSGQGQERDRIHDVERVLGGSAADTLTGGSGPDELFGGAGDDTIDGRAGDDDLRGEQDNDSVTGAGGEDAIITGSGDDTASGGADHDQIDTSSGNDTAAGGSGDDLIDSFDGNDQVDGGIGDDTVDAGDGQDTVAGGDGDDQLDGGADPDVVNGQVGDDTVAGGTGADQLSGGADSDDLSGGEGSDALAGNLGADGLSGGAGSDLADYASRTFSVSSDPDGVADDGEAGEGDNVSGDIEGALGGNGDDRLTGNQGNGLFAGGDGADLIDGAGGADTLGGGGGRDTAGYSSRSAVVAVTIGSGADDGEAGEGDNVAGDVEVVLGGNASDSLAGTGNSETLNGGPGDDSLVGGGGVDQLDGASGNDVLDGGAGDDDVAGGAGNDSLAGADGNDSLDGQGGDDGLDGGTGADILSGGAGNDLASYVGRTAALNVSLNSAADDGEAGEADNVRDDVEALTLGSGNDTADTRNSFAGSVTCGAGNDSASIDADDSAAADCETVKQTGAKTKIKPGVGISRLKLVGGKVKATLSCPAQASTKCTGTLSVRKGKSELGSKRFTIGAGKSLKVSVKFKKKAKAAARRASKLTLAVNSQDAAGPLSSTSKSLKVKKKRRKG